VWFGPKNDPWGPVCNLPLKKIGKSRCDIWIENERSKHSTFHQIWNFFRSIHIEIDEMIENLTIFYSRINNLRAILLNLRFCKCTVPLLNFNFKMSPFFKFSNHYHTFFPSWQIVTEWSLDEKNWPPELNIYTVDQNWKFLLDTTG
jgi:hypothetical protein